MSQHDVFTFLKGREWMTARMIGEESGLTKNAVANNLRKLFHAGFVERRLLKSKEYEYKLKVRIG